MTTESASPPLQKLCLTDLKPYMSVVLLECTSDDPAQAFETLRRFLRKSAADPGRADDARIRGEVAVRAGELVDDLGIVGDLGVEEVLGIAREVLRAPGWAERDSGFVDVLNQLSVAVRRDKLVAIYSSITTDTVIGRWIRRGGAPFRFVPADLLSGVFRGDGRMVWLRGVHRPRTTKPDSKALGGLRIQDALNAIEDSTFALTAAKVAYLPDDENALLRDLVTITPGNSRVSWKRTSHFLMFLQAVGEVLDTVKKALGEGENPVPPFAELAVPEKDLNRVRNAFDVLVPDPDQVRGEPDATEERVERAEFLRSVVLDVRGDSASARAFVDVGHDGVRAATLVLKPVESPEGVHLDVRYDGVPMVEPVAREIREALEGGDLVTVHYQSGHLFDGRQVVRQNLVSTPFPNLVFQDFSGFVVTKEKPAVKEDESLHDAIAVNGDDSLFAWVVKQFGQDWLLCDDGAGEVADFLHLTDDGTLTAIHVKAAGSASIGRRVAVAPFEQVVTQAEKNVRLLDTDILEDELLKPRVRARAAWHAGGRITSAEFIEQLRTRVTTDRTKVVIIQPHLQRAAHDRAREDAAANRVTRDTCGLALLDNVLHSTRRTVTALWDDLIVVGSA
ncbi:hypothetical protein [Amycolatopsis samaneae]|uniref:Uncharacterized protein n=1 Tax=Amycolatopsis samaneae TaxID=664691 RepID=A0ABW5GD56_9PSEU